MSGAGVGLMKFPWKTIIKPMMRVLRGVYLEAGRGKRPQNTKKPTFKQIYNLKKQPQNILKVVYCLRTSGHWVISLYQPACLAMAFPWKALSFFSLPPKGLSLVSRWCFREDGRFMTSKSCVVHTGSKTLTNCEQHTAYGEYQYLRGRGGLRYWNFCP